jgi:hypothetical protein
MPPPNHQAGSHRPGRDQRAHVHVRGRAVGVFRMQHQRNAHRRESAPGQFGAFGGRRSRQRGAADLRESDAAALEDAATLDDAGAAAAGERRPAPFASGRRGRSRRRCPSIASSAATMRVCRPVK